jgi:hypothetical protein
MDSTPVLRNGLVQFQFLLILELVSIQNAPRVSWYFGVMIEKVVLSDPGAIRGVFGSNHDGRPTDTVPRADTFLQKQVGP